MRWPQWGVRRALAVADGEAVWFWAPTLVAGSFALYRLRDDGILQVICPTCQTVFAGSRMAGDRKATLHGVVFDILGMRTVVATVTAAS